MGRLQLNVDGWPVQVPENAESPMVPFQKVLAWLTPRGFKAAKSIAPRSKYRPRLERLESRDLMAIGVDVRLDFGDGSASNSFHNRLVELTNRLGVFPFTTTEEQTVKQNLVTTLNSLAAQGGFAITEAASNPSNFPETLFFGRRPTDVGSATGDLYQSTLDWRNGNLSTEYVFPSEVLQAGIPTGTPRSQVVKFVSYALIHAGGTAIGAGLGADPATAFGDPSVVESSFSNTHGIPARSLGADASMGFSESQMLTDVGFGYVFRYSPLAVAQMQFGEGIRSSVPSDPNEHTLEAAGSHATPATAQALTLKVAASGESHATGTKIGFVGFGKIEGTEKDMYRFSASATDLVTIRVNSQLAYSGVEFDSVVRLIGPDGVTVLATNDDTRYDANSFGQASDPLVSTDSMILNFRIPTTGNYYIEVSSKGGGLAGLAPYDLLIANWPSQNTPWRSTSATGPEDSSGDNVVVPMDALMIVNQLNAPGGSRQLPNPMIGVEQAVMTYVDTNGDNQITAIDKIGVDVTPTLGYVDVNGDGFISPIDALMVINRLNAPPSGGEANGEAGSIALSTSSASDNNSVSNAAMTDLLMALYYGSDPSVGAMAKKRM